MFRCEETSEYEEINEAVTSLGTWENYDTEQTMQGGYQDRNSADEKRTEMLISNVDLEIRQQFLNLWSTIHY